METENETVLLPDRSAGNAIYITEVAGKYGDAWIENASARGERHARTPACRAWRSRWRPARGKTVVMAMLIAWQALNKLANPQDARFSDAFLIVTPGHHHPRPAARAAAQRPGQLLPAARHRARRTCWSDLGQAKIVITNFHAFQLRETGRRRQADQGDPGRRRAEPVHRDARPDGAPRLPRAGQQEEHRRHQRRGPPLLPPQARRRATRS